MNARAQDRRWWLGGSAVLAAGILLVSWFVMISPQRSAAAALRADTAAVQLQNLGLQSKINTLKHQDLKKLTTSLQGALAALPFDTGIPEFSRQLTRQASQTHVALTTITVGGITSSTGAAPSTGAVATGGVLAISITLSCSGTSQQRLAFLRAIQIDGPRRALVTSAQVTPTSGGSIAGRSTMPIQLTIFAAPLTAAAQAQLEKLLHGDVSG